MWVTTCYGKVKARHEADIHIILNLFISLFYELLDALNIELF